MSGKTSGDRIPLFCTQPPPLETREEDSVWYFPQIRTSENDSSQSQCCSCKSAVCKYRNISLSQRHIPSKVTSIPETEDGEVQDSDRSPNKKKVHLIIVCYSRANVKRSVIGRSPPSPRIPATNKASKRARILHDKDEMQIEHIKGDLGAVVESLETLILEVREDRRVFADIISELLKNRV